jgi:hypothetical protein
MDTTTIYPVIFFFELLQPRLVDSEIDGIYDDLESYLLRRTICDLTPKNYNRIFLSMLKHLRGKEEITRLSVQEFLLSLQSESAIWPDDDTFMQHFVSDPLYTRLRPARVQMILEALEKSLATPFQESMSLDSQLSIEHIWPQHPAQDAWPSVLKKEDGSTDWSAYLSRQTVINRIGNLTLVTPSFNSSLGNRAFAEKKPAIEKESLLRLNNCFNEFSISEWTEESILQRGRTLFSYARKIWPRA